jgi:hypothetical protein
MGIDIYARWKGQTRAEERAQHTGFSVVHGHVGYLREAYHGEPYATHQLVCEAVVSPTHEAKIPAAVLRERLPRTLELVRERERVVYHDTDEKSIHFTERWRLEAPEVYRTIPVNRDLYEELGYEDDAVILTDSLYDALLKPFEGKVDSDAHADLDFEEVSPAMIGKKWIVVVDYHN